MDHAGNPRFTEMPYGLKFVRQICMQTLLVALTSISLQRFLRCVLYSSSCCGSLESANTQSLEGSYCWTYESWSPVSEFDLFIRLGFLTHVTNRATICAAVRAVLTPNNESSDATCK